MEQRATTMGMDLYSTDCFLLKFSKFVKLLLPQHLRGIQRDAIRLHRQRMENINWTGDETPEIRKKMYNIIQGIVSAKTIDEVIEILVAIVNSSMSEDKTFGDDTMVFDEDTADGIAQMMLIQCISRVVLPLDPKYVRVFLSEEINGPVLVGIPVLEFDYSDCFETRMTAGGQALAHALGKKSISPDQWTDVSY